MAGILLGLFGIFRVRRTPSGILDGLGEITGQVLVETVPENVGSLIDF